MVAQPIQEVLAMSSVRLSLLLCFFPIIAYSNVPVIPSLSHVVKQVTPLVVNLSVQGEVPLIAGATDQENVPDPSMTPMPTKPFSAGGSGVIMSPEKGFILTNAHLLKYAKKVMVTLHDGRQFKAKIIGSDEATDIAVVKIDAEKLQQITLGDSNKLDVGDFVMAVGNPFKLNTLGKHQSVSLGIVSAKHRNDIKSDGYDNFIQTDAAINPGNSGGGLFTTDGKLVGITTALLVPYGAAPGNIGISFAVPINMAKRIMEQLIEFGSIRRGYMGVIVQPVTPELAEIIKNPHVEGAIVTQINPGSPAAKAGVQIGDIITAINDEAVNDSSDVRNIIGMLRYNSKVSLNVVRDNKPLVLSARITEFQTHQNEVEKEQRFLFGMTLEDTVEDSFIHGTIKGIKIIGLREDSPGHLAGVLPGDIIVGIGKQAIHTIKALREATQSANDKMLIRIVRGSNAFYVILKS